MERVFTEEGAFKALDTARRWCRENGVSYGIPCAGSPIGLMRGIHAIAKWRNLSMTERKQLDGTIEGNFRDGPVVLRLRDVTQNAAVSGRGTNENQKGESPAPRSA